MRISDEHADVCKALWLLGKKTGELVSYFGGIYTRNQILGKLWRMKIVGNRIGKVLRVAQEKQKRPRGKATVLKPTVRSDGLPWAKPVPMPTPSNASQRSFNCVSGPSYSITDMGMFDCHWPLGDPREKTFCYCAAPVVGLGPYCQHHWAVAYRRP